MLMVDTHCHLYLKELSSDVPEIMERASKKGIERIIVPGIDVESSAVAVRLAEKYQKIFAAVGIHPGSAGGLQDIRLEVDTLRRMAVDEDKIVAIGEIGLDNYRYGEHSIKQKELFERCLELASELDLPVILHCREAWADMLRILKKFDDGRLRGVAHCFSGSRDIMDRILGSGLMISFAGNITYPSSSDLRENALSAGLENILLETDSPYLSPLPHRGKSNEPSFLRHITGIYADIFKTSEYEVCRITSDNADKLFRLGIKERGVITYKIRDSLYINMTHRCTNRCGFCARQASTKVKGYDLTLGAEPLRQEIIDAIKDPSEYREIVFCGFGEPMLRLGALKEVASFVKRSGGRVRVNTNGEALLISRRDVSGEIAGLVDSLSISLNAPDSTSYRDICSPVFGLEAYESIIDLAKGCISKGIGIEFTCLDHIGNDAIEACRKIASDMRASFRLRHFNEVG